MTNSFIFPSFTILSIKTFKHSFHKHLGQQDQNIIALILSFNKQRQIESFIRAHGNGKH